MLVQAHKPSQLMMHKLATENTLTTWRERADFQLKTLLDQESTHYPEQLANAMAYAVHSGGKRLRACLVYACAETLACPLEHLDPAAMAVEIIHCYSLIHDDLPAMDDDDVRRGKPACHIAFDEATAILAGDALHSLAFECLADGAHVYGDSAAIQMCKQLSQAIGGAGMAGGQCLDMQQPGTTPSISKLDTIYRKKTGHLIEACLALACTAAKQHATPLAETLFKFASIFGLAFQIQDDCLEVSTDAEILGKPTDSDAKKAQPTYPSILGLETANTQMQTLYAEAFSHLNAISTPTEALRKITKRMQDRDH